MGKNLRWRVLLIVLVVASAIGGYVATGFAHARKEWTGPGGPTLKDALKSAIKLGLDLRGGIHLVLQVNTADAVKAERDDSVETLKTQAKDAGLGAIELPTDTTFAVAVTPQTDQSKLEDVAKRFLPDWNYNTAGGKWTFSLKDVARRQMEDNAVAQAVETIDNRVNEFGVAEPLIAREGQDRILVQLPGIDDPKRVKDLIKNTAFLELSLVESGPASEAALKANYQGTIPPQFKLVEAKAEVGGRERSYYVVRRQAVITGRDLKNARPTQGQFGAHSVTFFLTATGSQKFGDATGANIGKRLAIVLDNRVQSAPNIKDRITEQGVIEGLLRRGVQRPRARAARGRAAGRPDLPRGTHGRAVARPRLDPQGDHGLGGRGPHRLRRDGGLLPPRRLERHPGPHDECPAAGGRDVPLRGDAHAAGHRRVHPDDRHGG